MGRLALGLLRDARSPLAQEGIMRIVSSTVIGCTLLAIATGTASAAVQREAIIKEIQAAFDTWSQAPCTSIKFDYKGELSSYVSEQQGAILVYFGYDRNTWSQSDRAFHAGSYVLNNDTGAIVRGVIGLNAYKYDWSIGKEKDKIDIRTAVTRLLPFALGFYVGPDPKGVDLEGLITYDFVDTALQPLQVLGAEFLYFPSPAPGPCTRPGMPPVCGKTTWTIDGGGPAVDASVADRGATPDRSALDLSARPDAAAQMHLCIYHTNPNDLAKGVPYHWEQPIPWYVFVPDQGRVPGGVPVVESDGGVKDLGKPDVGGGASGGDSGCCRVSHAGAGGAAPGAVLVLALLAGLLIRSRRRR
jgi:MYXO-CTERM domain-containing protein